MNTTSEAPVPVSEIGITQPEPLLNRVKTRLIAAVGKVINSPIPGPNKRKPHEPTIEKAGIFPKKTNKHAGWLDSQ